MKRKIFPLGHDLLKLVGRIDGQDIHYCPERMAKASQIDFAKITTHELYPSLRHHCFLGWTHTCPQPSPITCEEMFLSFADWQASTISRKLRTSGYQSWETFRVWRDSRDAHDVGQAPNDRAILDDLMEGKPGDEIFMSRIKALRERSEDQRRCPFASLLTHSKLTKTWYNFLIENKDYFDTPLNFKDRRKARNYLYRFTQSTQRKTIYFIRMKIFPNEKLSRLADTIVIEKIPDVLEALQSRIPRSAELYRLSDELVLVACSPLQEGLSAAEYLDRLEKCLQEAPEFNTCYYLEVSLVRTSFARNEFLHNFNDLFGKYPHRIYPLLDDVLISRDDADDEAFLAKICELCQLAPAQKTFRKIREEDVEIYEFLCDSCYALRDVQFDENGKSKTKIGKDFGSWEENLNSHACFFKINLDLTKLNKTLMDSLLTEFKPKLSLATPQDIGFSIISEFLEEYGAFLKEFRERVVKMPRYVSLNSMHVLENLFCLRMDQSKELEEIIDLYSHLYARYFSRWCNTAAPITLSVSFAPMKYPFFEHWRSLSRPKEAPIFIQNVRRCRLGIDFPKYETLKKISTEPRTTRFLHKLARIEETTGNDLLVRCAIIENRRELGEVFTAFAQQQVSAQEILNFYKIFRR